MLDELALPAVAAELPRALLVGDLREDGQVSALRILGARITGTLNVRYAIAECAVLLAGCHFEQAPNLYGSQFRQLNLSNSVLPGLIAATIRIDGVLRLIDCRISGPVRLGGSKITQALFFDRTRIGVNADGTPAPNDEAVLQLNHVAVGDDLWWPGLVVHGEVRLGGAAVTEQIQLDDAELHHPGATALQAENLTVGSDVHGMRIRVQGRVNLRGARIPGQLNLAYAHLSSPGGVALRISSATIGELWLREAAPVEGGINLRRAKFDLIHADPAVWPHRVRLDV